MNFQVLVLVVAIVYASADAMAAAVTPQTAKQCVIAWMSDRHVQLSAEQVTRAGNVLADIAKRSDVLPANTCEYVSAQLDQVRWLAYKASNNSTPAAVDAVLKEIESDLKSIGLNPGELLEKLLVFGTMWHSPSGLIRIKGTPTGATVLINGRSLGLTNLDLRIKPGTYLVEVLVDGEVVFRKPGVTVEDGKQWTVNFLK